MRDKLKCGDCGHNQFRLEHGKAPGECRFGGSPSVTGTIIVTCVKCASHTVIEPGPPSMLVAGNLCGGWS